MLSTLCLLWDAPHHVAAVVRGDGNDGDWTIESIRELHEPDGLRPGEWTDWIAPQLTDWAGSCEALSVVLPRDRVTWRSVTIPPVPDHEQPPMIAMQLASHVSGDVGGLVIDSLPPRLAADDGMPTFPTAAIRAETLTIFRTLADRLPCSLRWVGPSTVALASLARVDSASPTKLIAAGPRSVETLMLDDGHIIEATGRRHTQSTAEAALANEQRRASLQTPDGVDVRPFASTIDGMPASVLDGLSLIGAAKHAWTTERTINFAAPHQAVAPPNAAKRYARLGALAAAAFIGAYCWSYFGRLAELDDEIATVEAITTESNNLVDRAGKTRDIVRSLRSYLDERPPAAEIIAAINDAIPDRRKLVLSELSIDDVDGPARAVIKGTGYATDDEQERAFFVSLEQAGFIVTPGSLTASDELESFSLEFPIDLVLPATPKPSAAEPAPASNT